MDAGLLFSLVVVAVLLAGAVYIVSSFEHGSMQNCVTGTGVASTTLTGNDTGNVTLADYVGGEATVQLIASSGNLSVGTCFVPPGNTTVPGGCLGAITYLTYHNTDASNTTFTYRQMQSCGHLATNYVALSAVGTLTYTTLQIGAYILFFLAAAFIIVMLTHYTRQ